MLKKKERTIADDLHSKSVVRCAIHFFKEREHGRIAYHMDELKISKKTCFSSLNITIKYYRNNND